MGQTLCQIIEEYEITDRLGYFITDNADSNDKATDYILRTLRPDIPVEDYKKRRIRCWGHVMNLAAKAFLFGKDPRAFEIEVEVTRQMNYEEAELEAWRRKGAIGKLHNFIVWVRRSSQRRELFLSMALINNSTAAALVDDDDDDDDTTETADRPEFSNLPTPTKNLMLLQDNKTRWNSTYVMLERALLMRRSIAQLVAFCETDPDKDRRVPPLDQLNDEDWRVITEVHYILQPFYYQTKYLEGRAPCATNGAIWEALPSIEYLLSHMERLVNHYDNPNCLPINPVLADTPLSPNSRRHMQECINNSWAKLDEYYDLTDRSPAYAAAVWLHPAQGWDYIDDKWRNKRDWIRKTKKIVEEFYESDWKDKVNVTDQLEDNIIIPLEPLPPTPATEHPPNPFQLFLQSRPPTRRRAPPIFDEYKEYNKLAHSPTENPLHWWRDHRHTYPTLSKMAFDILSIPAMSSECERVFSIAKHLITTPRNRLKDDIIEAIQLLKHWYMGGLF